MIIRTAQEQNAVNCCACDVPECAAPRMVCESVAADGAYYGYNTGSDPLFYTATRQTWEGGGVFLYTYVQPQVSGWINGVRFTPSSDVVITNPGTEDYTGEITTTYEGGVTLAAARDAVIAVLEAEMEDADYTGSSCKSSRLHLHVSLWDTRTYITKARRKFGVPEDYSTEELPRSVWEMQWDFVSASDDWWAWFDAGMTDPEPTPGPTLESSESWTWGGSMATEADQFSDWFDVPIPTEPGETRAVNILIKCHNSARLGVKPTAYGDQIALA